MKHALALIESDDLLWYDFCADRGHIPSNVARMYSVVLDFSHWLRCDVGLASEVS